MEGYGGGNVFGGEVEEEVKGIEVESGTGMSTPAETGETGLDWSGTAEEVSEGGC